MTTPLQLRVDLPRLSVGALAWGPADGPLALCLHGFPDSAWSWRHLGPYLAGRGWRVVAPFSRGYAPTDIPADGAYQVGALVRDVIDLHRALGGDGRAVLVGHDWGAITAYGVGAAAPGLFDRFVTVAVPPVGAALGMFGPGGQLRRHWRLALAQTPRSWYIALAQVPVLAEQLLPRLAGTLWARWAPGYDATEDLRLLASALPDREHWSAALGYYRALAQPWRHRDEYAVEQRSWWGTPAAPGVPAAPTLYVHGDRDGCLVAPLADRARGTLAPGSSVELLPGVGHFLHLEHPTLFHQRLAAFGL